MKYIDLTEAELEALPEYSTTVPTGTTIGKRWKRNLNWRSDLPPRWVVGEYVADPEPGYVQIHWKHVGRDPNEATFAEFI